MKAEFERNMMLASELMSYCHLRGASDYHLDIKMKDGSAYFEVNASPIILSTEELAEARKKLDIPRQRDVEQDFWEVMGEWQVSCELTLVGMMSDEVCLDYHNEKLKITIRRDL